MPLPPEKEAKLQSLFSSRNISDTIQLRMIQVAGMMQDQKNRQQIMNAVRGDTNSISEYMMKLRRWGIV